MLCQVPGQQFGRCPSVGNQCVANWRTQLWGPLKRRIAERYSVIGAPSCDSTLHYRRSAPPGYTAHSLVPTMASSQLCVFGRKCIDSSLLNQTIERSRSFSLTNGFAEYRSAGSGSADSDHLLQIRTYPIRQMRLCLCFLTTLYWSRRTSFAWLRTSCVFLSLYSQPESLLVGFARET